MDDNWRPKIRSCKKQFEGWIFVKQTTQDYI